MRRCLDCSALTSRGSRCAACSRARERVRNERRPGAARTSLPRQAKERDGHKCRYCGSTENLEAHHEVPLAWGGPNTLDNLVTLCRSCHLAVHEHMDDSVTGQFHRLNAAGRGVLDAIRADVARLKRRVR